MDILEIIKIQSTFEDISDEILIAKTKHPGDFKNYHEAYAVILEEIDELWDEIKKRDHDREQIREEATQAAAMLVRLISELT